MSLFGISRLICILSHLQKISGDLWFLAVTLEKSPHRLLAFLNAELRQESEDAIQIPGQTVLARYLSHYNFVEMHLDSIFKYGEVPLLPKEVRSDSFYFI